LLLVISLPLSHRKELNDGHDDSVVIKRIEVPELSEGDLPDLC